MYVWMWWNKTDGKFVIKGLEFAVANLVTSNSANAEWNPRGVVIDPQQTAIVSSILYCIYYDVVSAI